jgi:hypothetical protein
MLADRRQRMGWPAWLDRGGGGLTRAAAVLTIRNWRTAAPTTRRTGTSLLFFSECCGGPVARAIDPGQSVKPCDKKGVAPWRRGCFFGVVTPNPHARQNSPQGLKSNLQT